MSLMRLVGKGAKFWHLQRMKIRKYTDENNNNKRIIYVKPIPPNKKLYRTNEMHYTA